MNVPRSVSDVLNHHVTLELECIDRMYLNLYVPILQRPEGVAHFWIHHRGHRFASSALLSPMTTAFVRSIEQFAGGEGIDLIRFEKGQRKDEVARTYFDRFDQEEGVVFIGKAQEEASLVRTERRRNPRTGQTYPWLVSSTALVNHYYFYCLDRDFGPFFIKFCSYFPYPPQAGASMGTSISSVSWSGKGSPSRRSTMVCSLARTPGGLNRSATS